MWFFERPIKITDNAPQNGKRAIFCVGFSRGARQNLLAK
jgi:hypothetical protein